MKLSVAARDELRRRLREHRQLIDYLPNKTAISALAKEQLIDLAKKLGIDVQAIIDQVYEYGHGMATVLEPEELELWEHSEKHPAFSGTIEFDLQISLLGKTVTRRARIVYDHTPEWSYFDLHKKKVMKGWPGTSIELEVLAIFEREAWEPGPAGKIRKRRNDPKWMRIDILEEGVLSEDVWEQIDKEIETRCKKEDRGRRHAKGEP